MYLQVHYAALNFDPTTTGFSVWYFVFCISSSLFLYFVAVIPLQVFAAFVIIFTFSFQSSQYFLCGFTINFSPAFRHHVLN